MVSTATAAPASCGSPWTPVLLDGNTALAHAACSASARLERSQVASSAGTS